MSRVGGDSEQCFASGLKQEIVEHGLVVKRELSNRRGQGKDDVIVRDRQEVTLAVEEPAFSGAALTGGVRNFVCESFWFY